MEEVVLVEQVEKNLKFALYGYEYIDLDLIQNKNFQECLNQLSFFEGEIYTTSLLSKQKMREISLTIWNNYFQKLDRKILYLSEEEVVELYKELPSIEEIIDLFKQKAKLIDIFNLPIIYTKESQIEGRINKLFIETTNIEILKRAKVIFSSIELKNCVDFFTPPTYSHEVTHGLLERNKSSVKGYLNAEVLSMFMENLVAFCIGEDLLRVLQSNRLTNLKNQGKKIKFQNEVTLEDLEYYQYLNSFFLANLLFDTYQSKNKLIKKQLLRDIVKVFQGELILEEFLESREISLDNDDVVKCLEK